MVTAAVYLPAPGKDAFYHASTECWHGTRMVKEIGKYRVNTEEYVRALGKLPHKECWVSEGYHPEWARERVR